MTRASAPFAPGRCSMKYLYAALLAFAVVAVAPAADAQTTKTSPWKTYTKEQKAAKSKECSLLADQQGLKGKKRRSFRNKCKHSAN